MLLLSVLALTLFYFVHPAFFWYFLVLLIIIELAGLIQTARSVDDVHGGIFRASVLSEEDYFSEPGSTPDLTVYKVCLWYRDGTRRCVTLRENDAVLRTLKKRGILCMA